MKIAPLFVLGFVILGLSACGTKGKLKSPSQIEAAEAKKKAKAEKKADQADMDDTIVPPIDEIAPLSKVTAPAGSPPQGDQ